ncbi:MAG TPA: hypothetical protein VGU02_14200 [Gaiellaceae bacterium]|nr:hypothetical protein [Gaiellaceae bacterium]
MRAALAPIAVLLLIVWAISVAGATGWSLTVNWVLLGVAVGLLVVRRFA